MATYKEKVGTAVVNYAGNYPGAVKGELWYDSTNKDFKYQYPNVTAAGSWSTGGSLNTGRAALAGAGAGSTAALMFGGNDGPGGQTELYNGSSYSEVNDLNTGRSNLGGVGISTAALAFGGYKDVPPDTYYANTETWNGTNWTEVNDLNTGRTNISGNGTTTSALGFGGDTGPSQIANTESWNGTNWTEVNDLNQARVSLGGAGDSNTSGLAFGGNNGGTRYAILNLIMEQTGLK